MFNNLSTGENNDTQIVSYFYKSAYRYLKRIYNYSSCAGAGKPGCCFYYGQVAVDAAHPGNIVRVLPGIYHENVFVKKDNITIEGSAGAIWMGLTCPADILSQLPSGVGILIFGADQVTVTDNKASDNNSAGVAVMQVPPVLAALDPRINPFPDHNRISRNIVLSNGSNPDPKIAPFPRAI